LSTSFVPLCARVRVAAVVAAAVYGRWPAGRRRRSVPVAPLVTVARGNPWKRSRRPIYIYVLCSRRWKAGCVGGGEKEWRQRVPRWEEATDVNRYAGRLARARVRSRVRVFAAFVPRRNTLERRWRRQRRLPPSPGPPCSRMAYRLTNVVRPMKRRRSRSSLLSLRSIRVGCVCVCT